MSNDIYTVHTLNTIIHIRAIPVPGRVQSIKTDIKKTFDKSITIDNLNLNVIDFIDQSIELDTHNHRCSFKVSILSIYRFYRFH